MTRILKRISMVMIEIWDSELSRVWMQLNNRSLAWAQFLAQRQILPPNYYKPPSRPVVLNLWIGTLWGWVPKTIRKQLQFIAVAIKIISWLWSPLMRNCIKALKHQEDGEPLFQAMNYIVLEANSSSFLCSWPISSHIKIH